MYFERLVISTEEMTYTAKQGILVIVIILLSALDGCCEGNEGTSSIKLIFCMFVIRCCSYQISYT